MLLFQTRGACITNTRNWVGVGLDGRVGVLRRRKRGKRVEHDVVNVHFFTGFEATVMLTLRVWNQGGTSLTVHRRPMSSVNVALGNTGSREEHRDGSTENSVERNRS